MRGSEHAEEVLTRVLAARPWIDPDDVQHAGRARYARAYKYASRVSLQILYTKATKTMPESLEVGLTFDDPGRAMNTSNLREYREQLGSAEMTFGLTLRDGEGAVYHYLSKFIPLGPSVEDAYAQATALCISILDLALGGRNVSAGYRSRREDYMKRHGKPA